jgi:hypothetical protein
LQPRFDGIKRVDGAGNQHTYTCVLNGSIFTDALEKTAPRAPANADAKGVRGCAMLMGSRVALLVVVVMRL